MNDPYAPPSATIADAAGPGGRTGWKIYLWLMAAMLGLIFAVLGFDWMQLADAFDFITSGIGLLGLFGYAYRKPLLNSSFWKVWLPLGLTWEVLLVLVLTPAGLAYVLPEAEPTTLVDNVLGMGLLAPLYFALYRYAWRSDEIWNRR